MTPEQEAELNYVTRVRVRDIHKIWLAVEPSKQRFTQLLSECFLEGLECLKNFERWSRHDDLKIYVNVLESWDDKVCEDWESPDDNKLDCEEWLQQKPEMAQSQERISELMEMAFDKVDIFFEQL